MSLVDASSRNYAWCIPATYLILLTALYHRPYLLMMRGWNEQNSYCLLLPPVTAYLLWEKRRSFGSAASVPSWRGLLLVVPALLLYCAGELGGEYYTLYLSSWLLVVGLCWLHLGAHKVRIIAFPLCFSLAIFPLPNLVFSNVSLQLKLWSSRLGTWMIRLLGIEVYREGNLIDLPFTRLQVVDACSGLNYLIPLLILSVLLAHFFRLGRWLGLLLVACAVPVSVLTNSLRVALTGLLYRIWGARVAEGFFHDFSGWLIFMASLLLLVAPIRLLRALLPAASRGGKPPAAATSTAPAPVLPPRSLPHFLVVGGALAATVLCMHTPRSGDRPPVATPLMRFPLEIGGWRGTRSSMERSYLDTLKLSDYFLADYTNREGEVVNLYIAYQDRQRKGESTHSPNSCLPGSGWVFQPAGEVRLAPLSSRAQRVALNRAVIEKSGERMLLYYWFPQRGRNLTSMFELKLYLFWDAVTRRRTDGAMVRLVTPLHPAEGAAGAEARLSSFAREIFPLLPKFIRD